MRLFTLANPQACYGHTRFRTVVALQELHLHRKTITLAATLISDLSDATSDISKALGAAACTETTMTKKVSDEIMNGHEGFYAVQLLSRACSGREAAGNSFGRGKRWAVDGGGIIMLVAAYCAFMARNKHKAEATPQLPLALFTRDEVDKIVAEATEGLVTREEVDKAVAEAREGRAAQ